MSKMCSSTDPQRLTSLFLHFILDKENFTAVYDRISTSSRQSSAGKYTEKKRLPPSNLHCLSKDDELEMDNTRETSKGEKR